MTEIESLIYAALMHHGTPKTVAEFERAARTVAEMLERRPPADGEWRGLTGEERAAFVNEICEYGTGFVSPLFALAESLENVLKARNGTSAVKPQPLTPGRLQELWAPYAGAAPFSYARAVERAHGIGA